ncbi:Dihydrolipoyllysine-residue acetyltransferase [Lentibacillus sp. JNUCC-1]|uniref:dihydrolipoamide acetyltransferase family protein n=1 Tax=Lentibacillus sp. JNUCC-1 TaxID=2654513 RepID=UPI001322F6DF|nr:dihydrolipoamide acetyltransferase family protein [Lentibacillus sp. JNUCC-1]MUV37534.1 Dihydrolipoyllysine-residue acetyltransferase [Lentibacillus sp. JNUCC-1]
MLEVKLHDIGEGMTEGEIVHYLVKKGDMVKADQPLVEVQTDKMVAELPSPAEGIVTDIVVTPGETVKVGTTLMYIDSAGDAAVKPSQMEKEPQIDHKPMRQTPQPTQAGRVFKRVLATPHTRRIARERGIDIEQVPSSDASGRVSEADVIAYASGEQASQTHKTETAVTVETLRAPETPEIEKKQETIPFRGMRRQIARNMTKSLYTIPHVTHFDDIDMTRLSDLRTSLKTDGIHISVPAFLAKALVYALKEFPIFNAELDEKNEQIVLYHHYNIGVATDTEHGLVVPVVKDAHLKSLTQLHAEIRRLTDQATTNQLSREDMQDSTFTMSNVGPLGSTGATPIINYPETALIAFHKTKKTPVVDENDEIVIRQIMTLSLSFDHRVADGATAVRFTNYFATLLENPYKLMLEMI